MRLRRILQPVALVDLDLDATRRHVAEELSGELLLLGGIGDVIGERGPGEEVRVARITAFAVGAIAIFLAIQLSALNVAFLVG